MATPAIGTPRPVPKTPGRIGSDEYHSAPLPAAQEAAVLFAACHDDAAIRVLQSEIKDAQGRNNKQAWLLLFDLYQATQNREQFDALSMLFTVKFEQSPPAWTENADMGNDPRRAQGRERKDFFAIKPSADGSVASEVDRFIAFAEEQGTVRLDLGKVAALGPEEATLLAAALQRMRRKHLPMWFNGFESFEKVLRTHMNESATEAERPYWLLLFELHILQGKMNEFEDLGLEYAVAFEMSPPNWEAYVNTVAAAVARAAAPGLVQAPAPDAGFTLKGVLSAASANQMAEFNGHAASRNEVVADMGSVLRVDYAFTAQFFDTIKAIQLAGKRVILNNLNELNAALLEALGVNRYAILVRRKST